MRQLSQEACSQVAGGNNIKKVWETLKHKAKREMTRIAGQLQREFDRNVKKSVERMGGDTSDWDMDKARAIDQQKIQAYRDQEEL
jgi:hypothetical protein